MQTLLSSQEASWTFQTDSQAGAGVPKCLLLSPERQIWGLLKEKEKKSYLFKSSIRCDFNIRILKSANYLKKSFEVKVGKYNCPEATHFN